MVLHLIGLGLADEKDITVRCALTLLVVCDGDKLGVVAVCDILSRELLMTCRGLEIVKRCKRVYLESYTSLLLVDSAKLVCSPSPIQSFICKSEFQSLLLTSPSLQEDFYGVSVTVADREMVETVSAGMHQPAQAAAVEYPFSRQRGSAWQLIDLF